jgi:hypothetical protein
VPYAGSYDIYCSGSELQQPEATAQTHYAEKETIQRLVPYLVYKYSQTGTAQILRQDHTELFIVARFSCGLFCDMVSDHDYTAASVTMTD